jgi:hypothetical protein
VRPSCGRLPRSAAPGSDRAFAHSRSALTHCAPCSDAWIGDVGASNETFGYAFRGRRIIKAALTQMVTQHGMGTVAPGWPTKPRLLFGGCSAGARGAMVNLDFVAETLASLNVSMEVSGLLDSAIWLDVAPAVPNTPSLADETYAAAQLFNASDIYGDECAAAMPAGEAWRCLLGQYRMPFLQTPYLANEAQFDSFQLEFNEGGPPPYNASATAYAVAFQSAMTAVAQVLPTSVQTSSSMFSAACYKHCVTTNSEFWSIQIKGVSLRDVALAWWNTPLSAPRRVMDTCRGFKCGFCRENLNQTERLSKQEASLATSIIRHQSASTVAVLHGVASEESDSEARAEEEARMKAPPSKAATQREQARQQRRNDRMHGLSADALRRRTEAITLAVIGAVLACLLAGCCAQVSMDKSLLRVIAQERAPAPPLQRPDESNAMFGVGSRKGVAGPGVEYGEGDESDVGVGGMMRGAVQRAGAAVAGAGAAYGGYSGFGAAFAGPFGGGTYGGPPAPAGSAAPPASRYVPISAAVGTGATGAGGPTLSRPGGSGGIAASLGYVGGAGRHYSSQASLSLEQWRPSAASPGSPGRGSPGQGRATSPTSGASAWAAAAAAAQQAAAGMLPQPQARQPPGWQGAPGAAGQLGDRL